MGRSNLEVIMERSNLEVIMRRSNMAVSMANTQVVFLLFVTIKYVFVLFLTLSCSLEGSPAPAVFRHH